MYTVIVTDMYSDDASSKTTSYQIQKDSITIGRSQDNDITIRQTNISSKHASIVKSEQGIFLKDLNSTNGTIVNKLPLQGSIRIFEDDQIEIGGAVIRVTGHPDLERGREGLSPGGYPQGLGISQPRQSVDELFGSMGNAASAPRSEPPSGDDFSLSKIAADPFGSSRLSVSLDSLIPAGEDEMYRPPKGASPSDPFPISDGYEGRNAPYSSKTSNLDLLDKIKALESKVITDKGGNGEKAAPSRKKVDVKAEEGRQAPKDKPSSRRPEPIPPLPDDLEDMRDAIFAPFPDAENESHADEKEHFEGSTIAINALDPVPADMKKTANFSTLPIAIGRDAECEICLSDSFVSSRHAVIEQKNGRLGIRDLGSRNGTFLNNRKIFDFQVVESSDVISVGRFRFNVLSSGEVQPKGGYKPRKTADTSFDQKSPFQSNGPKTAPPKSIRQKESFPGVNETYEKVIDGNLYGVSLQLYLAKTAITKALADIQARPLSRNDLGRICRPLSGAVRILYKAEKSGFSEPGLQEIVDSVIELSTQSLELISNSEYFSMAKREIIKAHSILFPLSSSGCGFFETTGASVGLSLLSELGFLGVQRKGACTTKEQLLSQEVDIEGVMIAGTKIGASLNRLPYVRSLAKYIAELLFFDDFESSKLINIVDEACANSIEHGFEFKEQEYLHLSFVILSDNRLAVVVDDKGIPFDTEKAETGGMDGLGIRLMRAFSEEVHFLNLGRRGKRVVMILPLPEHSTEAFFSQMMKSDDKGESAVDIQYVIETVTGEQADEISRCAYRAYGYEYFDDLMYRPTELKNLLDVGRTISAGAFNKKREMIGHMSVSMEEPDAKTGTLDHMIIVPSLNSANMASKLTTYLIEECREKRMSGLLVNMTASHPYEQVVYNSLGARMTGIMLGHFPSDHERIDSSGDFSWKSRRQSSVAAYLKLDDGEHQQVFLPQKYTDLLQSIYAGLDLNRELVPASGLDDPVLPSISNVAADVARSLGVATIKVLEIGDDIADIIEGQLDEFNKEPIAAVYVDLPLTNPAISSIVDRLEMYQFCFSCLIPEDRYGDILRLQIIKTHIDVGNIHIEDNAGKAVLRRIEEERIGYR
jgi:serine/threonine-protein kinase RsbW